MLQKHPFLKIYVLFIIWRAFSFAVAALSPKILPKFGATFPYWEDRLVGSHLPHFIWSFGNFDGVHYLGIAKDAYAYQFTQAFFPLYPVLIKALTIFTKNYVISGLLISNAFFLIGLFIFYKLVKLNYSESTAIWSVIFLLATPTSFYFGAIYTEGIFFLMIVSSFYALQNNKFVLASIIGMFASATRLVGLFLAFALSASEKTKKRLLPIIIVPLGLLSYIGYLQIKFHNPLYFLSAQSIFGQERSTNQIILLPQVIWRYLKILTTTSGLPLANASLELASTIFAFSVLFIAFRKKFKREWLIFSLLALLVPTLSGTFASMPRYLLIAFPIYIVLAQIQNLKVKIAIITTFLILQVVCLTLFAQGYWVA